MSTGVGRPDNVWQNLKAPGVSMKRVALGVIDSNVPLKNTLLEPAGKQPNKLGLVNLSNAFGRQNFSIYHDQENLLEHVFSPVVPNPILTTLYCEEFHKQYQQYRVKSPGKSDNKNRLSVFKKLTLDSASPNESPELPFNFAKEVASVFAQKVKTKDADLRLNELYRKDIFDYLKSSEAKFLPKADYMDKQSDITMTMRSVLVDWLIEVAQEYKLDVETVYLSVSYVDRFLSQMSVLRGKLQLVGTASMFLAAKYEEIYPPELSDYVYITDDTYTKQQILRMEHLLLKVLNFDIAVPTAYSFLRLYCSVGNASQTTVHLSQYICELSLLDGDPFLAYSPSLIAAGAYALANFIQGQEMWDLSLAVFSGYQVCDFTDVMLSFQNKYISMPSCRQQAVYEKYKTSKYGYVSTMQLPGRLIFTPQEC